MPDEVNEAYDERGLGFGVDFIIPKPMDPRLITTVAPAVALAAMESGVAREPIRDWDDYKRVLAGRLGQDNTLVRNLSGRARRHPKRIVFAEADHYKVLKAAETARDEGIVNPILLGSRERILGADRRAPHRIARRGHFRPHGPRKQAGVWRNSPTTCSPSGSGRA